MERGNFSPSYITEIYNIEKRKKRGRINNMFNFRIITMADVNQIIDRNLKTPYEALTPMQMVEYTEMDNQMALMDRMERKAKQYAEQMQRLAKNPFYRMACIIGLI